MVIFLENPIHSLLFLILTFCNLAGLILLLEAEFLTLLFIIVYVGAIAILFLFVFMMLNLKIAQYNNTLFSSLGGSFLIIFCLEILIFIKKNFVTLLENNSFWDFSFFNWFSNLDLTTNIELLSQIMYTYYFLFFLMGGLILLLAMIGSILLTMDFYYKVKRQQLFEQVTRNFERALFLTKVSS